MGWGLRQDLRVWKSEVWFFGSLDWRLAYGSMRSVTSVEQEKRSMAVVGATSASVGRRRMVKRFRGQEIQYTIP